MINIGGRLHSTATGNIVAGTDEIYDDAKGKKQNQINTEVLEAIDNTYTKEQINEKIVGPGTQFLVYKTIAELPATGEVNTIYKVANYNGTDVDTTKYCEYAWDSPTEEYILMAVREQALEPLVGYYTCDSLSTASVKVIAAPNYILQTGGHIKIKMTNKNDADNVTLNINNTGAKELLYKEEQVTTVNTWLAGEVVEVYYDGNKYHANNVGGNTRIKQLTEDQYEMLTDDEKNNGTIYFIIDE